MAWESTDMASEGSDIAWESTDMAWEGANTPKRHVHNDLRPRNRRFGRSLKRYFSAILANSGDFLVFWRVGVENGGS